MIAEARVGTSGFAYREWIGSAYPRGLAASQLLPFYAQRLAAVEIASTTSRLPTPEQLGEWAASVPPGFQFALKVPSRICLDLANGKATARAFGAFLEGTCDLGEHLGPVLFQLPDTVKADRGALAHFLEQMPEGLRLAFQFGHPTWRDDATLRLLSQFEAALVLTDDGEGASRIDLTAGFTYVRIRRNDDRPEGIAEWAERLAVLTRRGVDVYAFLQHDRKGLAMERAMRLSSLLRTEYEAFEQPVLS